MRWFRRKAGEQPDGQDLEQQRAIIDEVRQHFGVHRPGSFHDQAAGVASALTSPVGVGAAAGIVHEFAESAYREIYALAADLSRRAGHQFVVDRGNYRPLWKTARRNLAWPLFSLPNGLFPYVHVAGAVRVLDTNAQHTTDRHRLLAHLFEILDLTIAGWEFAGIRVDADGANLVSSLITTTRGLRMALPKEPPLPTPIRELMRRNNTIGVYAVDAPHFVGSINPGKEMREVLLA